MEQGRQTYSPGSGSNPSQNFMLPDLKSLNINIAMWADLKIVLTVHKIIVFNLCNTILAAPHACHVIGELKNEVHLWIAYRQERKTRVSGEEVRTQSTDRDGDGQKHEETFAFVSPNSLWSHTCTRYGGPQREGVMLMWPTIKNECDTRATAEE